MTIRIVLVRHGEAEHNVAAAGPQGDAAYSDPRWQDAVLTERGRTQASVAGKALSELYGGRCILWTSPLQRTIETAVELSRHCVPEEFHATDAVIERLGGGHVCNDRAPASVLREAWKGVDFTGVSEAPPAWTVHNREPVSAVRARMQRFILELRLRYADSSLPVIVVTHHDAIHALTGTTIRNAGWVPV